MKRFLGRAPLLIRPSVRHMAQFSNVVKIVEPLAENIEVDSEVLRSLRLHYYKQKTVKTVGRGNTRYELRTPETSGVSVRGHPITKLEDWRRTCSDVLEKVRCYPTAVHQILLEECGHLVYSHPDERRKLLDDVMTQLIEAEYPITSSLYDMYLSTVLELRQNVDLKQVFSDLEKLNLPLNYDTHNDMLLADTVCTFLALQGETQAISNCWDSFVKSRRCPGFTDRSFGIIATAHIMRGEFDELFELQNVLERSKVATLGHRFYSALAFSMARTGNVELLEALLRKEEFACVINQQRVFIPLCLELIESGNEEFISNILPFFEGVNFQYGRDLEVLACDVISRGAVRFGADLVVHGGDLFEFINMREREVYELETLPDIMRNMPENMNNILIQIELRGVDTHCSLDFKKIDDDVVVDIEKHEGEFPESRWIQELYSDKMAKRTFK